MKKILLLAAAAIIAAGSVQAKTADELRIYLNPGHGSYGPNDRPMSTIGHPNTSNLADTDTLGFYEGRGTLPRSMALGQYLQKMGVKSENIVYSRLANGPWPYNANDPDEIKYEFNKNLADICEEVESGNFDMFISDHSNAATDGTTTNYPLFLYRGYDKGSTGDAGYTGNALEGSWDMCNTVWDTHFLPTEIEPQNYYSLTNKNLRGDISFYGSYSTSTRSNGKQYAGYLGVLKHGVPGFLLEGFFHTYQPARHRALNFDWDRQEGRREARGVGKYFNLPEPNVGDIMGTVKDLHEKISHNLFNYVPGTNDQWNPLNGATVKLMKNGTEVKSYTVDQEYNGIFVFEDVEPGNYKLVASLDGFKQQGVYSPKSINGEMAELVELSLGDYVVKANETTYARIYLESESYEPPTVTYENYPDPDQPAYQGLPSEFKMKETISDATIPVLEGKTVRRAILHDGKIFVLAIDQANEPYVYVINPDNQSVITQLSTEGIASVDNNQSTLPLKLSDIAFTADGTLIACNHLQNQFSDTQVDEGKERGTFRVYRWEKDNDQIPMGNPIELMSSQLSGNYYNADVGATMAFSGSLQEGKLMTTAITTSTSRTFRTLIFSISDGALAGSIRNNNSSATTAVIFGEDLKMNVSPLNDNNIIVDGSNSAPVEFALSTTDGAQPAVVGTLPEIDPAANGATMFRYAKHSMLVTPDGAQGVKLFDITDGLDNAEEVAITLVENSAPAPKRAASDPVPTYEVAGALVDGADLLIYHNIGGTMSKLTTEDVSQPVVKGIYAYALDLQKGDGEYTFTFDANSDAVSGKIIFTDRETGEVLGEWPLTDVVEGTNTVTLTNDQIPGDAGMTIDWAVNLVGKPIPSIGLINNPDDFNYTYTFNTVDRSPESKYFGRVYVGHRPGTGSADNGLWIYEPDYTLHNTSVINKRTDGNTFRSNYRMAIDAEGKVYMPDWGDPTSGVYVFDPDNEEQGFYPFFATEDGAPLSRNGDGLLTNAEGVAVGGSSPGVNVVGSGADTKLFVYNEDIVVSGSGNNVSVYSIGNEDGTIAKYWNQAPDVTYPIGALQANTNGNVWGRPDGSCWVAQYRGAGNNTSAVPSLIFVDPDGNVTFNSGTVEFSQYLNGSAQSGFAVNDDESMLVICDGNGELQFFNLSFDGNTPSLTPLYSFKATAPLRSGNTIYQMNFDYAGNLVCSGAKVGIYSIPTDDNQATTPARSELFIDKSVTAVNGIEVNKTVKSVRYVNAAGMQSDRPFEGVNIVVTNYTDGTTSTRKVIK